MEQLAAPGSILVTEQTHKLTAGYFEFKPLGKTQIKGVEEPLSVYEVIRRRTTQNPLASRSQAWPHPFCRSLHGNGPDTTGVRASQSGTWPNRRGDG